MNDNSFRIHSVKYNFFMNVMLKVSGFIFPLITFPYISRILGAAYNGKIAFATSYVSYFVMFAVLGIPTYGVKVCAACRDDKEQLSKTVQELLVILTGLTLLSYIAFGLSLFLVPSLYEDRLLLIITSAMILLSSFGVEWFYQSIEQYGYITYRNLLVKIVSIILMFVFVTKQEDYIRYGVICVLGSVGSNFINMIRLKKYISFHRFSNYNFKKHLKPIGMLFLYVAAVSIYTNLDSVMLKFMTNDEQVGYYGAAIKIKLVLQNIVTALGTVLLPKVSYYLLNKKNEQYKDIMKKSFNFVILTAISAVCLFEIEAGDCILLLAGDQYVNAIPVMRWIIPTVLFIGISSTTGTQILIPSGRDRYAMLSTLYGAVTDVVLNVILIPLMGAAGAAIATLAAEIVVTCTQIFILRKDITEYIDSRNVLKIFALNFIAMAGVLLVKRFINIDYLLIKICVMGFIYGIIVFIFAIILKEKTIDGEIAKILKKIKL